MVKKKTQKFKFNRWQLAVGLAAVVVVAVGAFIAFGGVSKPQRVYYGYKSQQALNNENQKLGEPLKALGFTNIEGGKGVCQNIEKAGYTGKPLDCTATFKTYRVFNDQASKDRAITAAAQLSTLLKQNGWHQGNYEVGKWFKDVLNHVDYNADAYHYKYYGNTFCMLDFFVAYANPKPPAVNVLFSCTDPEKHPPVY